MDDDADAVDRSMNESENVDDDDGSNDASSSAQSFSTSRGSHFQEQALRSKIIQEREDRQVNYARTCVMIVVCMCAVAVSVSIFFFAYNSDEKVFTAEVRRSLIMSMVKVAATERNYH
jgi:hypothetical protein